MDPDKQAAQTGQHCSTQQATSQQDLTLLPGEGCYSYCYHGMEKWVCDSSDEKLLTIALLFSPHLLLVAWLLCLPCPRLPPTCPAIGQLYKYFSLLPSCSSHTSKHLTTLACCMVLP